MLRRLRRLRGSVRLGQSLRSFPRLTPPTFLQPWPLLRKALIRAAKTSYTAGTLYAIILPRLYLRRRHPWRLNFSVLIKTTYMKQENVLLILCQGLYTSILLQ
jgi:hypothetical protein